MKKRKNIHTSNTNDSNTNVHQSLLFDSKNAIIMKQDNKSRFEVEFYEKSDGTSEIWNYLEELRIRSPFSKDARIRLNQISLYIELLQQKGTRLPANITKHLEDDIWELRPGNSRILYFFYIDNRFVLLHCFRKKTRKTPKRELEKARTEMNDYLARHKETENENMERL